MKYIGVAAISIDGFLAKTDHENIAWNSKEDKSHLHKILNACDGSILGNSTYKAAKKYLDHRKLIIFSRKTEKPRNLNGNHVILNPANTPLKSFVKKLGWSKVCVLGGSHIYGYFVKHNLLDELYVTVEPVLLGSGVSLLNAQMGVKRMKLHSVKLLNRQGTILAHYKKK